MHSRFLSPLALGLLLSLAAYAPASAQTKQQTQPPVAQPQPPAAQPQRPAAQGQSPNLQSAESNLVQELERWESILKEFQKLREDSDPVLSDKKKSFETAEQTVSDMLTQLQKAIDEGKAGGPLLGRLDEFIAANKSFLNELGSAPSSDVIKTIQDKAMARQQGLESDRAKVVETYNAMLGTMRDLNAQKDVITLLKKDNALEGAYMILRNLVKKFEEAGSQALAVQNGLRRVLNVPTQ